jgi:hypothetical protein
VTVIHDPTIGVDHFPENPLVISHDLIFGGYDLQRKKPENNHQKHRDENKADYVSPGLIKYRHG